MSMRYPGGFIASTPVTANYPSGVWTQAQAIPYQAQNVWTRDQYWPYTTLLLQGNGTNGAQNNTFLDSSSNNFTITRNGNTTQGSFTPYEQDGYWSNYFDGNGDYLSIANNTALNPGTGDFTLEGWVYIAGNSPLNGSNNRVGVITVTNPPSGTVTGFALYFNGNSTTTGTALIFENVVSNTTYSIAYNATIPQNVWHHVAVSRSGTTTKLFLNGAEVASGTLGNQNISTSNAFTIGGGIFSGYENYLNGYVSNLRLIKGTALYTSNFTPSAAPLTAITNTSLLTCQSNRFIDNSTNNFAITRNGDTSVQAFQPFPGATTYSGTVLGGSGYFDGTGDYLSVANNTALELGSSNFTIEAWVYLNSFSTLSQIIGSHLWGVNMSYAFFVNSNKNLDFYISGNPLVTAATNNFNLGTWNHCVAVRSGSSFAMFLNGSRVATATIGTIPSNPQVTSIGADAVGDSRSVVNGYISNLRLVKGTAVYDPSQLTLTVPTAPVTPITNTSLLTNFTNAGIFDAAVMNDLETVGNAQVSTSVVKYGTGSMYFDGNGDYLVPSSPATNLSLVLGSGDMTIEMWVYFIAGLGSDIVLYDSRPLSTNGVYPTIYVNSSSQLAYVVSSSDRIVATTAFTTGQWYHIAICRSGTSTRMFINGTQTGSTYSDSNNYLNPARRPVIAINGFNETAAPLNGYIDDLRVTRAARYITNFTPPPARMPGQ